MKRIVLRSLALFSIVASVTTASAQDVPAPRATCDASTAGSTTETYAGRGRTAVTYVWLCDSGATTAQPWGLIGICSASTGECIWQ